MVRVVTGIAREQLLWTAVLAVSLLLTVVSIARFTGGTGHLGAQSTIKSVNTGQFTDGGSKVSGSELSIDGQTFEIPENGSASAVSDGKTTTVTTVGSAGATTKTIPKDPAQSAPSGTSVTSNGSSTQASFGGHSTVLNSFSSSQSYSQDSNYSYSSGGATTTVQTSH
jgi:hypothetical protein